MSISDPRTSPDPYRASSYVGCVCFQNYSRRNAPIHNQYPGYNCQDYVLELLDDLEGKGIVDGNDRGYRNMKEVLSSRQDGLE